MPLFILLYALVSLFSLLVAIIGISQKEILGLLWLLCALAMAYIVYREIKCYIQSKELKEMLLSETSHYYNLSDDSYTLVYGREHNN